MADLTVAAHALVRPRLTTARFVAVLALLALALTAVNLWGRLPVGQWWPALIAPAIDQTEEMLVAYSFAPRLVVSLLAGAALGLAGALLQQILRNPIASPTTLGVQAGANLALATALVWAPGLIGLGREGVAFGGGLAAIGVVLLLSRASGFAPLVVVLSGMVAGLACAALAALLVLFNSHYLAGLFLWGAGSLSQQGWAEPASLAPRLLLAGGATLLLVRPLTLLGLEDSVARSLGLSLAVARLGGLLVAVALTACVVASVGGIGFVGLAAPALAAISGARRVGARLAASALIGATLLWATDQAVQLAAGAYGDLLPTGAVTAVLGAPLLLWMVPRLRLPPHAPAPLSLRGGRVLRRPMVRLVWLGVLLAVLLVLALGFGPGLDGWSLSGPGDVAWFLRLPRVLSALAGGAMLALAGGILQRMTGNPLASPEVLGVSAGAACGLLVLLFLRERIAPGEPMVAASLGAFGALLLILALARASRGAPERVVLVGIAVGALLDSLVSVLMASGDPRAVLLFNWMTGSTYGVDGAAAFGSLAAAAGVLVCLPLIVRWLDILPLGEGTARALGVPPMFSRTLLLVVAAVATAFATLIVGPLSFVGLIAPHLARLVGLRRPLEELLGAALLGALVMVTADFAGRTVAFPWQLPAGLVASMIGAPAFLWLLSRRQNAS